MYKITILMRKTQKKKEYQILKKFYQIKRIIL